MAGRRPRGRATAVSLLLAGTVAALGCAHPGPPSAHSVHQEGLASYYSASLVGRSTASGERYDPEALTAAHPSLPFGTVVRVERLGEKGGNRSVEVRINDRGPFVRGRVIDLSGAAAHRLGMLREGVVPVRLRLVSLP